MAFITIPTKSTSDTLSAAEFNQLLAAIKDGTLEIKTLGVTADAATINGNIAVTGTVDGRDVSVDGTKLDTLVAGANVTSASNLGDNLMIRGDGSVKGIQNTGIAIDDLDNITDVNEITVNGMPVYQITVNSLSTGVAQGGYLSINVDTTKFDISDGFGIVLDQFTDPVNPTFTKVSWSGLTAQVPAHVLTRQTFVGINSSGTVVQQAGQFTCEQRRSIIVLGLVVSQDTVNVDSFTDQSHRITDGYLSSDTALALGNINTSGNNYSAASTDLTIRKEAGETFGENINRVTNEKNPNNITTGLENPVANFIRLYNDGAGGPTLEIAQNDVNPTQYDDGSGTLATVGANKFTNQAIYFFPASGITVVQYGDTIYNSLADAQDAIGSMSVLQLDDGLVPSTIRSILSVRNSTTDLSLAADTAFNATGKFGLGGGGGAGGAGGTFQDLQETYNNSVTPEILTDSTRGALTVKQGSGSDNDLVFEGQNGVGTNTFTVDGNGNVTTLGTVDGIDIATEVGANTALSHTQGTDIKIILADSDVTVLDESGFGRVAVTIDGTEIINVVDNQLRPSSDSVTSLGTDTRRWSNTFTDVVEVTNVVTFSTEHDNGNSGTSDTIDWNNSQKQKSTLTGNVTFNFTDVSDGIGNFLLKLIQDGTGSRTVTWPGSVKWASGTAPTLTTTAAGVDIVSFYFDGTSYYGAAGLDFS